MDVLKRLRSYLEDTPKEQVLSDWKATADKSSNNDERFSLTKFINDLKNK